MESLLQNPAFAVILMLVGTGLQMMGSKLAGEILIAIGVGWLWWIVFPHVTGSPASLTEPLLFGMWIFIIVLCTFHYRKQRRWLRFTFSEFLLDRSNSNMLIVLVKVANPTASTITGVSVRIISVVKVGDSEESDMSRTLKTIYGHPLMLHGDHDKPPRREIDLHAGATQLFNVVQMQQEPPELIIWHTMWREVKQRSGMSTWHQYSSLPRSPGLYHIHLEAQGRDVPTRTLSIEFEITPDVMRAQQIK